MDLYKDFRHTHIYLLLLTLLYKYIFQYYKHFIDLCGWPSLENSTSLSNRLNEFSRVLVSEEYRQLESLHPGKFFIFTL